ncbi:type II secretion system protein GspG [Methylotenera sp. L2L1]|uniref:type II secretion system protein GspG n=1 Tax=Methylotenera sp. L2L1 TaxID=1502770 RepID=UPI00055B58A9|nr:type II secretion system protein GspG [Methylotenera sp. L2L1]
MMSVTFQKKHMMVVAASLCDLHKVVCAFFELLCQFVKVIADGLNPKHLQCRHAFQRNAGFTLLELLVVVALMSVVAVAAVMSLEDVDDTAAIQVARSEMVEISKALKLFKHHVGHFPDAANEIKYIGTPDPDEDKQQVVDMNYEAAKLNLLRTCQATDISKVTLAEPTYDVGCKDWSIDTARGWYGPYLSRDGNTVFVNDPWGNPYVLRGFGSDIRIISFGADGAYGGDHAVVDPVDICKANDASALGKDDLVLCLLM